MTLKSTKGSDYSVVIETVDATASQTVSFQVSNGLSTRPVHVWSTNLNSANASDYFVQQASITPSGGVYSLTLQPGYVYTLTTTTGQGRGKIVGPPPAVLGLPYSDDFNRYAISTAPLYFSDQNGAFEIVASGGGRSGRSLRQMAPKAPINWDDTSDPYTLLGDLSWTDYTVRCDVLLEQAGYVEIMGRVGTQRGFGPAHINAYYLRVTDGGAWSILKNSASSTIATLLSGSVAAPGLNSWHTLALSFQGNSISAQINGTAVGTVTDSSYSAGQVGLGVSGWQNAQFDNFNVTTTQTAVTAPYYKLVNHHSGKVLDVSGGSTAQGSLIIQSTDSGATSQQWQFVSADGGYIKLINRHSGDVLAVPNGRNMAGVQLDQQSSNGGPNQQWQFQDAGDGYYTLVSRGCGLVAAISGASTADGAGVVLWPNNGGANEQWQLVVLPTAGVTYQLINRSSGKVLDVSGESTADGGVVIQWVNHGGANQQWSLVDAGSGYFTLVNLNSGKVLAVPAFSTAQRTQLDQWSSNGGTNQQWQLQDVGGGYYTLVSRSSGLVAAVSSAASTPVIQAMGTGAPEQQWQFSLL